MSKNDTPEKPLLWEYARRKDWEDKVAEWPWEVEDQEPPIISFTKSNSCPHCNHPMDIIVIYGPRVLAAAKPPEPGKAEFLEGFKIVEEMPPAVKNALEHAPKTVYVWCNCSVPHPPEASTNGCGTYGHIPFKDAILKQYL